MQDSIFKTFFVTACVCLVCSILVASAVVGLRPIQEANKVLDKKINILTAAGLVESQPTAATVDQLFSSKIRPVVINLETGLVEEGVDAATVNERSAVKDNTLSVKLDAKADTPRIGRKPILSTVYFVEENGELQKVVFPIYGKGLWSTMYGFIVLNPDFRTVASIIFYDHGETPGLGGEIANPNWQARWENKLISDENGKIMIHVIKGSVDPQSADAAYSVDGISGSTLTSKGVSNAVRFWLGENGFGPFIESQRQIAGL